MHDEEAVVWNPHEQIHRVNIMVGKIRQDGSAFVARMGGRVVRVLLGSPWCRPFCQC